MGKNLNILLLPDTPYPTNRPMLISLWNYEFIKRGNEVTWIMQSGDAQNGSERRHWKNSELILIPKVSKKSFFQKIFSSFRCYFFMLVECRKTLMVRDIDWVHAHDGAIEGLIGLLFAKMHSKHSSFAYTSPFVETKKQAFATGENKSILKYISIIFLTNLYAFIFKNVDLIFPISKNLGYKLANEYNLHEEKIFPVYECASELFMASNIPYDLSNMGKIIYVGSMDKARKIEFLLLCFKEVLRKEENIRLILLGWSKDKKDIVELKQFAKKLRIEEKIDFIDKVPYKEVPKIISKAHIGLSPIPPEDYFILSTPTKTIEYLSLGIPVVANKEIIDQKEIIEKSEGGLLVEYNEEKFANAILWLLKHQKEAKSMGKNGRLWIIENRTFEQLAIKMESKYLEILT